MMAVQCHDLPQHCTVGCAEMNVWDKQSSVTEEKVSSLMSISARPKQWNKTHAPHSRTFRNEWIQSWNYKTCKWVNNSQHVPPSVIQLWKKHFWKEVQFLKVWLFREKIHFLISDNANQCSVQSWNTHRHHETIICTWRSQEVGSSRSSSNFAQHMPGQNLCSDTDYLQKDFTWYSSVPPAKCQGSAIN